MQLKSKTILIKLTGEALSGESSSSSLNPENLKKTAEQLIAGAKTGNSIAVVVGGGNILRGAALSKMQNFDRVGADQMGMLATIINAIALKEAIRSLGHPSEILTSIEIQKVAEVFTKKNALRILNEGSILILGGGTGNPYFTTDTTAALRALEIDADYIFKATKVDGIYNKDPKKFPDAVKYEELTYDQAIQEKLEIMDQTAFTMCREHKKEIIVFNFLEGTQLAKLLSGKKIGTRIHP